MRFNFCRLNYLLTVHFWNIPSSTVIWATHVIPSSGPGHKRFWKRETLTGSMFSLKKTVEKMYIAHVRIVTEGYLGFPQWQWFSNCLQTSNSINHKCCIKTCEYFILTIKENCQTDNYGKFWKKICWPGRKLGNLGNHGNLGKWFSDVSFPSFRLRHRVYSKTRKMKTRKIFSEVSEISEKSEFSNCHFLPNFQKSGWMNESVNRPKLDM